MNSPPGPSDPIGVFDSGIGGLSVLRELVRAIPSERYVYYADTARLPYGSRGLLEVRGFCEDIVDRFRALPVKMTVVACNTASAAALKHLRARHPGIPFVGMEPAVKPAAAASRTRKVGVLATQATFQGRLFESVVERFAQSVEVLRQPCPGLAEFIERHPPDHPGLDGLLRQWVSPLVAAGIDALVLACTHYPLVKDRIQRLAGPGVAVIDPAPAIARRVRQVLSESSLLSPDGLGRVRFFVSGDRAGFSAAAAHHWDGDIFAEAMEPILSENP